MNYFEKQFLQADTLHFVLLTLRESLPPTAALLLLGIRPLGLHDNSLAPLDVITLTLSDIRQWLSPPLLKDFDRITPEEVLSFHRLSGEAKTLLLFKGIHHA